MVGEGIPGEMWSKSQHSSNPDYLLTKEQGCESQADMILNSGCLLIKH